MGVKLSPSVDVRVCGMKKMKKSRSNRIESNEMERNEVNVINFTLANNMQLQNVFGSCVQFISM